MKSARWGDFFGLDYYNDEEIEYFKNHKKDFLGSHILSINFDVLDVVIDSNTINSTYHFTYYIEDKLIRQYSTPLILSIIFEREDLVQYLLLKGADPNFIIQDPRDNEFFVPLILSIDKGNINIIRYLLDAGVSVKNDSIYSKYEMDHTMYPLTYALSQGKFDIIY